MDFQSQAGSCLCSDIRYHLDDDPLRVYACHCTDCQRQSASSFTLSMIVRREALKLRQGQPDEFVVELSDGRRKQASYCRRCCTRLWNPSRVAELALREPGTLDDASWVRPVGHIWMRSAQGWLRIPDDVLRFGKQSGESGSLELVRACKERGSSRTAGA